MDIEFRKYDGTTTAKNPRIEKRGDVFTMKLDEKDCEYFLILSKVPGGKADFNDTSLQNALIAKKERLLNASYERLVDGITFSCIEWSEYRVNDYAIDLTSQIAEYTLYGCKEEEGKFIVFIPNEDMTCTASISLTVQYSITMTSSGGGAQRLFGPKIPATPFYVVEFDPIPDYQDGSIFYTFDNDRMKYPITCSLIENGRFFVDAGAGMPRFYSQVSGLELRKR